MATDATTIVRAALDLLRADGLQGVTFRRLSTRLGVAAPAIYWRFANKQELLEAMAEQLLRARFGELSPVADGEAWTAWLTRALHTLRRAMLDYPDGARVVAGARPLHTPTLGLIPEYALAAATDPDAVTIVYTALHFTYGHVIAEQDSTQATQLDEETAARFAERFPTVLRVLRAATESGTTPDDVFDRCLARIIGGPGTRAR